jgi:hypothetical protein
LLATGEDGGSHEGGSSSSSGSSSGFGGSTSGSGGGGSSGGSGGSSTSSSSGGTIIDDASIEDAEPTGGTCPENAPFSMTPYTKVTGHQGVCTAADVSAFEAACGDSATDTTCNAWLEANLGGQDGAGGTACGNCIIPPTAPQSGVQGAAYVTCDASQQDCDFAPNYVGCVQLVDPTHGPACAVAWDPLMQCEGAQCDDCASSSTYTACQASVDEGVCGSYTASVQMACATDFVDGGVATTCEPGGGVTMNPDWTFIIDLICGGGGG